METDHIKELFQLYRIWNKFPDAIIYDKEEWDHKIIFYTEPKYLHKYASPDSVRKPWEYYTKQTSEWEYRSCYPVIVQMYEYNNHTSWDWDHTDIWIGTEKDIILQEILSLKKLNKREKYEYKNIM